MTETPIPEDVRRLAEARALGLPQSNQKILSNLIISAIMADRAIRLPADRGGVIEILRRHVTVYTADAENDVVLKLFGLVVAEWDKSSAESVAILKLDRALASTE